MKVTVTFERHSHIIARVHAENGETHDAMIHYAGLAPDYPLPMSRSYADVSREHLMRAMGAPTVENFLALLEV